GVYNLFRTETTSIDALLGFRYLNLEEHLGLTRSATALGGANRFFLGANIPGASTANFADEFDTRDQFFGGQLGARYTYTWNRLTAEVTGKVALGGNYDLVNTFGTTTLLRPGLANATVPGGLLVAASNGGRFHETQFGWIPEVGVHLGYAVTRNIHVFAGY